MLESVDRFKRAIRVAGGLWEEKIAVSFGLALYAQAIKGVSH